MYDKIPYQFIPFVDPEEDALMISDLPDVLFFSAVSIFIFFSVVTGYKVTKYFFLPLKFQIRK
jgi:hypothetical protein